MGIAFAALLLIGILVSVNTLSHALAWDIGYPQGVPEQIGTRSDDHQVCKIESRPCSDGAVLNKVRCPDCTPFGQRRPERITVYVLLLAALSLLFGRGWRFLNDSTVQPLYRARVVRAPTQTQRSIPDRLPGCNQRQPNRR